MKNFQNYQPKEKTFISVLIPVKNEGENIEGCLNSILNQSFNTDFYEIIVIDDCSTDNTRLTVEEFIKKHDPIKLLDLKQSGKRLGKKNALTYGIEKAKGDLIVTTDADCTFHVNWLQTISGFYETYKPEMIICPVILEAKNGILNKFQELEFSSLQASGAGAAGLGIPFMCNGANLAFSKKAFLKVNGYSGNENIPSGDDVFLLHKFIGQFGSKSVEYLKSSNTIVFAQSSKNLRSFFKQRIRWASKAKNYSNTTAMITSIIVFLFNFSIPVSLIIGTFNEKYLLFSGLIFLVKLLIDLPILLGFNIFLDKSKLLLYYLPLQIAYPFYISITGIASIFSKNKWEKR